MFPETNPAPGFAKYPDHQVKISRHAGEVVVEADGVEVARSREALVVEETNHEPVYYLPMEHIDMACLRESSRISRCPFKGKARYWNVRIGHHEIDNAVRAYEMPYDEVLELAGLATFDPHKVKVALT